MMNGGLPSSPRKDAEELHDRQAVQHREEDRVADARRTSVFKDIAKKMGTNAAKKFTTIGKQWKRPF